MHNIYIKKLTAYGNQKRESTIDFSPHLTIIYGASNTGKTYIFKCIKYLLGSKTLDIEENTGYNEFMMVLSVDNKDVSFFRKNKSNNIIIKSDSPLVESGTYTINYDSPNNVNVVYLKLLEINDELNVPFNKDFEMKRLTFPMLLHIMMISENIIERNYSILFPKERTIRTYFLSHLLYLIYGIDFSIYNPLESEKAKRIRKTAISQYINDKLLLLRKRSEELISSKQFSAEYDYEAKLQRLTNKLTEIEEKLIESFNNGQSLLKEINEKNERIAECTLILNRYVNLENQLISDIERLSFIKESSNAFSSNINQTICPHCSEIIEMSNDYKIDLEDINFEINRILSLLNSLKKQENYIQNEIKHLEFDLDNLSKKKDELELLSNTVLNPTKDNLIDEINSFKEYVKIQSELNILRELANEWHDDINQLSKKEPKKIKYNPFDYFDITFEDDLTEEIQSILSECNYLNPSDVSFSLKEFDIYINKNPKRTNGKGFIAFYNTLLVLAIRKYLYDKAEFKPFFYMIDSPLLGLDVGKSNIEKNNIIQGIYNYFINSTYQSQLIIMENEKDLPNIDLIHSKVKCYHFTGNKNEGQYGFLLD